MSLPALSIRRPVAVAMLFVAVVFLGGLSFVRLPVDLLPDVAYPKLVVYTTYPDVGPAEVERFITEPIEAMVSRVPGLERVESITREGVSMVILRFAWGTDMDFAALNVRERIDQIRDNLPEGVTERPIVLRTDPRSEPVLALSVAGDTDLWTLKELAESVFRRRLEQVDGVAQATVTGGLEREIQVDVDPHRLEAYNLTIDNLAQALAGANAASPSGTVRQGRYRYSLRTLGELQTVQQIEEILVAQRAAPGDSGAAGRVLVRDVATVTDGFRERESIARYNGRESIGLLVFKESGANTVRVAENVDVVLEQLRAEYPGISIDVATSQAGFIAEAIANLIQEMIMGGVLAFLVLVLFLRDARYPIAISLAIPISIIGSFALLHAFGVSLNIMSLGGLALGIGMLVDNSIVVIENIFRHREKGLAAAAAAAAGTEEVQRAITASTITTIAVFGPIIYVEGVAGELFAALSFAVAFSLLASLVVAILLLPTMAARWEGEATNRMHAPSSPLLYRLAAPLRAFDRAWERVARVYERSLAWALAHRGRTVAMSLVLLVVSVPFALDLDRSVLPDVDQGEFRVRIQLARGTTLEATAETAAEIEARLLADDDVDAVFSRVGKQLAAAGIEEDQSGLHTALLDVRLKPGHSTAPVIERVRAATEPPPGGSIDFETGQGTALGRLLGGGEADLAVRVRGDDLDSALVYAGELRARLVSSPALTNVRLGTELGQPEYLIELDRERAAAYGLDAQTVARTIENYMRGALATQFVDFDRKIDIYVRLPDDARRSLRTLDLLRVNGIPLRELVTVREALGPVEIRRIDQARIVPIFADVAQGGLDGAVAAVRAATAELPPPTGMRVDVGGENEEMQRGMRDLALAFTLAVLLVYMILAAEFESLIHPFTIMLSVPLAIIGAVFALWIAGSGLNTVSLIGIVILVGVVDNNAVVMIDFINQQRRAGLPLRQAIIEAGRDRVRPIVMTTLTTMLAVVPMMLGIGAGGSLQAPLAVAVFGGLFTATALTLLVIPVVYELLDGVRERVVGRVGRRVRAGVPEPATGD